MILTEGMLNMDQESLDQIRSKFGLLIQKTMHRHNTYDILCTNFSFIHTFCGITIVYSTLHYILFLLGGQ